MATVNDPKMGKLLEIFKDRLQRDTAGVIKDSDRALYHALAHWHEQGKLPKLDGYFHKAFRQVDVTDSGHMDMVIWNLLNGSDLFWRLYEKVQGEKETDGKKNEGGDGEDQGESAEPDSG